MVSQFAKLSPAASLVSPSTHSVLGILVTPLGSARLRASSVTPPLKSFSRTFFSSSQFAKPSPTVFSASPSTHSALGILITPLGSARLRSSSVTPLIKSCSCTVFSSSQFAKLSPTVTSASPSIHSALGILITADSPLGSTRLRASSVTPPLNAFISSQFAKLSPAVSSASSSTHPRIDILITAVSIFLSNFLIILPTDHALGVILAFSIFSKLSPKSTLDLNSSIILVLSSSIFSISNLSTCSSSTVTVSVLFSSPISNFGSSVVLSCATLGFLVFFLLAFLLHSSHFSFSVIVGTTGSSAVTFKTISPVASSCLSSLSWSHCS